MFFFFNNTAPTEIYTLPLHDALPICVRRAPAPAGGELRPRLRRSSAGRLPAPGRAAGGATVLPVDAAHLGPSARSEEHTSELQSQSNLVCRLLLDKKHYTYSTCSSWQ